jgi:putative colanic acid biosynthesis acetyltransferase WcaF
MTDLNPYINHLGRKHQIIRALWSVVWSVGASWLPRSIGSGWKRFLLRLFGARIAPTAIVYSTAKIYYPANLTMDEYACIASDVDCYNVAHIHIGKFATVSQDAVLCTASHDITSPIHDLITSPITIGPQSWVGAGVFIKTGVQFKKVCGWARVAVFNNVYPLYVQ